MRLLQPCDKHCDYSDWTRVRLLPIAAILDTLKVNHSASGVGVTEDLKPTILLLKEILVAYEGV